MNHYNIKLCKDCANYSYSHTGLDRCNTGEISLVTGEAIFRHCIIEREHSNCGHEAKRWVPKPIKEVTMKEPSFLDKMFGR